VKKLTHTHTCACCLVVQQATTPAVLSPSPSASNGLSSPSRSRSASTTQLSSTFMCCVYNCCFCSLLMINVSIIIEYTHTIVVIMSVSPQLSPQHVPSSRRASDAPPRKGNIGRSASGEKIYLSTRDQPPPPCPRVDLSGLLTVL
jgi:hypothetical protein